MATGLLLALSVFGDAEPRPRTTPPLGFNTWNHFGCAVSGQVLMDTADAFVTLGLDKLGYTFINSDDCWMMKNRSAGGAGPEQPQPAKFPKGMKHVADYVKSQGLQLGLYTTRANQSCAGYAGSCGHELVDVQQWSEWGVTYMKDDSCGNCGRPVQEDYRVMQAAIRKVGAPMILTIEGGPNISEVSGGCCGQARRVGHDISPDWVSMISLVDQASGLAPYAHNGSRSIVLPPQPFFNDLDMLELGNGEFNAEGSVLFAAQARTHYSMWCVMKAVMLLGADLTKIGPQTLAIIKNAEAVAINQDAYGNQARRIAVQPAKNASLSAPWHALAVLAPCVRGKVLQSWRYRTAPGDSAGLLWIVDADGRSWCLAIPSGGQSRWIGTPCDPAARNYTPTNGAEAWLLRPAANESYNVLGGFKALPVHSADGSALELGYPASTPGLEGVAPGYGASGPVPHTRWVAATVNSDMNAYMDPVDGHYVVPHTRWKFDLDATVSAGSALQSTDEHIIDNDNQGKVSQGGEFCLELNSGSSLEVWAAALSPTATTPPRRRWSVALLNRSPSPDTISLDFVQLGEALQDSHFSIRDIWANKTHGPISGKYSTTVGAHDTALLVLTEVLH